MGTLDVRGPFEYDDDPDIDEFINKHVFYIQDLARKEFSQNIGPAERDDLVQDSLIKLWLISKRTTLTNPKAYIRRIVHTTVVDTLRKFKPHLYQALPVDDDGEIQEGNMVVIPRAELRDPEAILEEKETLEELMGELVNVVSELHPRQRYSAICTLKDRVDDLLQFVDALQEKGIESDLQWPLETIERQRLQASYSPAKRKVASSIGVDLSLYK